LFIAAVAACGDDGVNVTSTSDTDTDTSESGDGPTTNDTSDSDPTTSMSATMADTTTDDPTADTTVDPTADTTVDPTDDTTTDDPTDDSSSSDDGPGPVCGDDVVNGREVCDGEDLGSEDCASQGFDAGTLSCDANCELDTTECSLNCGNGTVEDPEACDTDDFAGADCVSEGFDAGELGCSDTCELDTTGCISMNCGNGVLEGMETCDGMDVGAETCATQGFDAGVLGCDVSCNLFDTSACTNSNCCEVHPEAGCDDDACEATVCAADSFCCDNQWDSFCTDASFDLCPALCETECGDGITSGAEQCDGADLENSSCGALGFFSGTLACDVSCNFDTTECNDPPGTCCTANGSPECTDDACEAAVCAIDPTCCSDVWDQECADAAAANDACLDVPTCPGSVCGDGTVNGDEVCEDGQLNGQSCGALGYVDPPSTNCCAANGAPGCDNDTCEATVCAIDPFCCNNQWDSLCGEEAIANCGAVCNPAVLGCDGCDSFDTSGCAQNLPTCVEQDIGSATGPAVASGNLAGEDEDITQSCGLGGVDRTIRFIVPQAGTYVFDTVGSGYDTVLSINSNCNQDTALGCNDDAIGAASQLTLDLQAGQSIVIAVSGFNGQTGNWILNITAL